MSRVRIPSPAPIPSFRTWRDRLVTRLQPRAGRIGHRERVQTTFLEDLRDLVVTRVPEDRSRFRWHEPKLDSEAKHEVDVRINGGARPLYVFGLTNDDRVRDATITLQQLEAWQLPGTSLGIFGNQQEITRKVLARFTDHCDRQFSSLVGNEERIAEHIERVTA